MKAIGLIETKSLIGFVTAIDAMVRAVNVKIVNRIDIDGGLVTAIAIGGGGSVRASIEAGIQ
ncbi:BMC domain-containing protein [Roseiconus lacunae]|uniref:BMC domain-containing protein n=1 Tax=Roseiconus lacunae TaxID=2605694 RepID=UPI0030910213|nr:BMC domain-containing protein [Stieleria sp. HD01]